MHVAIIPIRTILDGKKHLGFFSTIVLTQHSPGVAIYHVVEI